MFNSVISRSRFDFAAYRATVLDFANGYQKEAQEEVQEKEKKRCRESKASEETDSKEEVFEQIGEAGRR